MDIDTPSGIPMELFKSAKVRKDAARFRTLYKEMNNTDSVNFAAEIGWSGAWVLLDQVLRATKGSLDDQAIIKAATALDVKETILGYGVKFDANHQNERALPALYQWDGGVAKLVIPREYSAIQIKNLPLPNNY